MAEISGALGLSGSSVYRHLPSKEALLEEAIDSALGGIERAIEEAPDFAAICAGLASVTVSRPDAWILVRRELRHLGPQARAAARSRVAAIVERSCATLAAERPDLDPDEAELRARMAIACLAAPSQYPHHDRVDVEIASVARVATEVADGGEVAPPARGKGDIGVVATSWPGPGDDQMGGRRAELLAAATELFSRKGYRQVSLDDIGAAVGMSGPSVYHHFSGKSQVLLGVLAGATGEMEEGRRAILRAGERPAETLALLVRYTLQFALRHAQVFRIFINDAIYLAPDDFALIDSAHRRHVATWTVLAESVVPADDPVDPVQRVACALSLLNELVAQRPTSELVGQVEKVESALRTALTLPALP